MTCDVEYVSGNEQVATFKHYPQPIPRVDELVTFQNENYRVIDVKYRPDFFKTIVYLEPTDETGGVEQ